MIHQYLLVAVVAVHGVTAQATLPYSLSVTSREGFIDVAVKADGARLADVATDLSKRLGARIIVGPSMRKETISVNLPETPLEQALASLAPHVLVDYEIRQDARPVPKDIYLLGVSDAQPPLNTDARGMSQGLLITGHTEETAATADDDPLKVTGDKNLLTITSKKQPLSVVVMAIADVLGVPVDLNGDANEPVDIDVRDARPEDLIPRLSPNLRVHVRVDLNKAERTLLRLVVAPAAAR